MKIIKIFDDNQLGTVNFKDYKKYSFFRDKTDGKVAVVSLRWYEKLKHFFQQVLCICSHPKISIGNKSFRKISYNSLNLLAIKHDAQGISDDFKSIATGFRALAKMVFLDKASQLLNKPKQDLSEEDVNEISKLFKQVCKPELITEESNKALEEYLAQPEPDYNEAFKLIQWRPELS